MYTRKGEEIAGEDGMEGPPVPIPNTEVKLHHADDTWRATAWKIRYLPAPLFFSFKRRGKIIHLRRIFLLSCLVIIPLGL